MGVTSSRAERAQMPIAVFARPPHPGTTKTRLAPALGEAGAAHISGAFLLDTLRTCRRAGGLAVTVWSSSDPNDPALVELVGESTPRRQQPNLDLGGRMQAALEDAVATCGAGLVVGSDAPTLPASILRAAVEMLGRADAVIGPSADGGYYLVGVRGRVRPMFEGVTWSSRRTLRDTLAAARRSALKVALLPPWYDVDTPADLDLLRAHLTLSPGAAPATARVLGL